MDTSNIKTRTLYLNTPNADTNVYLRIMELLEDNSIDIVLFPDLEIPEMLETELQESLAVALELSVRDNEYPSYLNYIDTPTNAKPYHNISSRDRFTNKRKFRE
jgi:hypothetical protein